MSVFRTISYFYVAQVMILITVDVALSEYHTVPSAVLGLGTQQRKEHFSLYLGPQFGQFATGDLLC